MRRWVHAGFAALALLAACAPARASAPPKAGGTVVRYVDPAQQTALWFGARSHWLQPWRAYLDTVPTARLRDAVGINLNVEPAQADAVCRHLAAHGFCKVRIEFGWGTISWDDSRRLADPGRFEQIVAACKRWGLRPLFLLNAHHGAPCPARFFTVRLAKPASKGDLTVALDPADVAAVVPGRTGLSNLSDYRAAEALITRIAPDGAATLSRPLPKDLPAGPAPAATLKYMPFYPSRLKDGTGPPQFGETMQGWLDYVAAICVEARRVLGTDGSRDAGFDLEVWNELTFGSDFLSINNYYARPVADGDWAPPEILRRTVAYVADPANGLRGVGVSDGFNNQWPWGAGSTAPPGLTALGKHPYAGARHFPKDQGAPNGIRPVDALGRPDGVQVGTDQWRDTFVPSYVSHFPEYFLSAIQTEHLVRDLSPITTEVYGVKHGRLTRPVWPNGRPAPAPQIWVTEVNLDPAGTDPGDVTAAARAQRPAAAAMTPVEADRMKAKATLRYLVSFVNKGPVRFYFYAARDDNPMGLGLVSRAFFRRLNERPGLYPGDASGVTSPTMAAVRRLVAAMAGGAALTQPRALSLIQISETHGHRQFEGDPATAAIKPDPHPPLWNRQCVAFLPFQATNRKFVVPVYVMTRNLAHLYRPQAKPSDTGRFDMPPERYVLSIGGLRGIGATVTFTDPLDGTVLPAHVQGAGTDRVVVDLELTDSPRLLTIEERAAGARPSPPPRAGR